MRVCWHDPHRRGVCCWLVLVQEPGTRVPWVDELVCARIPDMDMLKQFKMAVTVDEAKGMLDVCAKATPGVPKAAYAYLDDAASVHCHQQDGQPDQLLVVHPDIGHDFGITKVPDLLEHLIKNVAGKKAEDKQEHWSLKPKQHKCGKLVHYHEDGPHVPNEWCERKNKKGECDKSFPQPETEESIIGEDRRVLYRRGRNDVMIVPYNPWFQVPWLPCEPVNHAR